MLPTRGPAFGVILPLALLAGCGGQVADNDLDALDNELVRAAITTNTRDPALASALQDQIMVDPGLVQQANANAVRPPAQPRSGALPPDGIATGPDAADTVVGAQGATASQVTRPAPAPAGDGRCPQCSAARRALTLGALAASQGGGQSQPCTATLRYSAGWANRLSPELPLYPDARLSEAAGTDGNGCQVRAVSFASTASLQQVLDWYYTRASGAGYTAEHRVDGPQHLLAGTRRRDGGAFTLFVTARADGGSDVDLVVNRGA